MKQPITSLASIIVRFIIVIKTVKRKESDYWSIENFKREKTSTWKMKKVLIIL